jgi:methyl-accepting chemotaxis protein
MNEALPEVRQGVALADSASESLRAIEDGARSALDRVHDVANATREQSAASTSIAQQVEQIAQMVDETSVTIRANAATAESLEEVARKLKAQISKFEI